MKKRMIVILALVLIMLPTLSQVPDFASHDSDAIQHVLEHYKTSATNEVSPSQVAWEWITQTGDDSGGDDNDVFLKVYIGVLYWEDNSTKITEGILVQSFINGTESDYGYVNTYGRISNGDGHLYLGGFDSTWDYVNASIWAMDIDGSYDDLVWESELEVQRVLDINEAGNFVDDGAEAFIRNDIGYPNRIETVIYTSSTADYVHAPSGVSVSLRLRSYPTDTNYTVDRVTDAEGFVYWSISESFAQTLSTGASPYVELYYSTNVTLGYTLVQRFHCLILDSPTITTTATENGVYIDITPDYTLASISQEDFGEYAYIQGQPDTILFSVTANTSSDSWEYSTVSNIYRVFLPDTLTTSTDYNVTIRQTMQANYIFATSSFNFTIPTPLFITERLVTVGYSQVSLSATTNANCSYTVYEGSSTIGSGTVSGNFVVYWNRASGTGDQSFLVNFTIGTAFVSVNGTYSKATPTTLDLDIWDLEFDDAYCNFIAKTTWGNTTLYIYDNNVLRATSAEADVVQYRKLSTNGVHEVGVLIDGGADSMWKNFTYSIAVIVEELKLTVFEWDTGSPDTVSGQFQTNWANTTITIVQGTTTKWEGTESDTGVSFYFQKTQSEQTFTVTVTIDGGGDTLSFVLGYSWRAPVQSGSVDMVGLTAIIRNQTVDVIRESLASSVVVPPAVFAGIVGFLVLLIAIVLGQLSWTGIKKVRKKKSSELLRTGGWM